MRKVGEEGGGRGGGGGRWLKCEILGGGVVMGSF